MIKVSLLVISLFFSFVAIADNKVSRSLAIEYLELSKIEQVINTTISQTEAQIFPGGDKGFNNMMVEAMGWDATKDQLINIIITIYTKEEIEASISFMKSPVGASATAKSEEFSKQFAILISTNMQEIMKKCCAQAKN
jgi:hypothetical protein